MTTGRAGCLAQAPGPAKRSRRDNELLRVEPLSARMSRAVAAGGGGGECLWWSRRLTKEGRARQVLRQALKPATKARNEAVTVDAARPERGSDGLRGGRRQATRSTAPRAPERDALASASREPLSFPTPAARRHRPRRTRRTRRKAVDRCPPTPPAARWPKKRAGAGSPLPQAGCGGRFRRARGGWPRPSPAHAPGSCR